MVPTSSRPPPADPSLSLPTADEQEAFAAGDQDRIAGLGMVFEPARPPPWVREAWARDAKYDPIPPGHE
jgi:hypothetical protein